MFVAPPIIIERIDILGVRCALNMLDIPNQKNIGNTARISIFKNALAYGSVSEFAPE